jgi:agmatinase
LRLKPVLQTYLNKQISSEEAKYMLFGAPLDITTSNRRGTRFGPSAIRRESNYLDTLSVRSGLGWDDLDLIDAGDLQCKDVVSCLNDVKGVVSELRSVPFMLGGEHTVTLGSLRALRPDLAIVYDAHLDLRDELFGERLSHGTYLRRGFEELGFNLVVLGARALSREEVDFADSHDSISYISSLEIIREPRKTEKKILDAIAVAEKVYLSIDMDILDPSYAPAVGNPHPEGLSTTQLMDLINSTMSDKMVGFDLTEVCPHYDSGVTATTAAYIVMETLYSHTKNTLS